MTNALTIAFDPIEISDAPLRVLHHLSFYIAQYGLSVKQRTGADQKYWKLLSTRLRAALPDTERLEKIATELDTIASGDNERRKKFSAQREQWSQKEVVMSAQLESVLAALPGRLLNNALAHITHARVLTENCRVVKLKMNQDFVEPDLLLQGDDKLLMVEVKTRGGPTSARNYSCEQLVKYMRLVAECCRLSAKGLPTHFTHVILVPTRELQWLEGHESWVLSIADDTTKRMLVNSDACIRLSHRKYGASIAREIEKALADVPIYYRAWDELAEALALTVRPDADTADATHWTGIVEDLRRLSRKARRYAHPHSDLPLERDHAIASPVAGVLSATTPDG